MDKFFEYISNKPSSVFLSMILLVSSLLTFLLLALVATLRIVFCIDPNITWFILIVIVPVIVLLKHFCFDYKGEQCQ